MSTDILVVLQCFVSRSASSMRGWSTIRIHVGLGYRPFNTSTLQGEIFCPLSFVSDVSINPVINIIKYIAICLKYADVWFGLLSYVSPSLAVSHSIFLFSL